MKDETFEESMKRYENKGTEMEYKQWDRIVCKSDDLWFVKAGDTGVINKIMDDMYEVGLDNGKYVKVYKSEMYKYFRLDSKLSKALS